MHDVVRSFAEFMAKEEMLVVVHDRLDITSRGADPIRRLCIGHTISEAAVLANFLQNQKSIRTLCILSRTESYQPADFLSQSFPLRVLYIKHAGSGNLVPILCELKHLRCLYLEETDISRLPNEIDKLKFLRHIVLIKCTNFEHLPDNIIKLQHLRHLALPESNVTIVPKGFGGLTNLRHLGSFPVHIDKDANRGWCSLEEVGPLSQLRYLIIKGIDNAPASSSARKAMISSQQHLRILNLECSSIRYMKSRNELEKQQQQQALEDAFEELCPPSCIEHVVIVGYFGRQLPNWMMVHATADFKSLRFLELSNLACCNQLPDGLCQLPSLEVLHIKDAPVIKNVGREFQASFSSSAVDGVVATSLSIAFPNLTNLYLIGMCEWEEWVWEELGEDVTAEAMPSLKELTIKNSKLGHLPAGLASSKRYALRQLYLSTMINLTCVDNFPSVVELHVSDCRELKRISRLSRLRKVKIIYCPTLAVVEGVPALDTLLLEDAAMETLPEYLRSVNPRYLELYCSKKLYNSLSQGSSEWNKISHIKNRNISFINLDARLH